MTIDDINDNLIGQLTAKLDQSIPLLPRAFLRVLARALAGLYVTLYKYIGWIGLQQFVTRASFEPTEINGQTVRPLVEWGRLIGEPDPAPAVQAELEANLTVTSQGGTLPSGTQFTNPDTGITYTSLGPTLLNDEIVQVTVRATGDQDGGRGAGAVGNMEPGDQLALANPVGGVRRNATVTGTVTAGSDAESAEDYRDRVVSRFRRTPQGGAYTDYAIWATQAADIINAYPYTSPNQAGIVEVYVESGTEPDGIPTQAQLDAAEDQIWQPGRRPANAFARLRGITRRAFDVEVDGLDTPNTGQVQADIEDALTEYLTAREPFIRGLSVPPREDRISAPAVAAVVSDIVSADGGVFNSATVSTDSDPVTVYELEPGEKAKLGAVSYV